MRFRSSEFGCFCLKLDRDFNPIAFRVLDKALIITISGNPWTAEHRHTIVFQSGSEGIHRLFGT
jgi:hypothetical protein